MIAIYARQSVERPDSISIAMQVEHCRRICPAEAEVRVFTDRGFTGTNTHRPAFREMLEAVEQGEVESVYVYKLDRISRSLCDFAAMMQTFRRRNVTLHSVRESFDTRTEIGGMLLNLLMMFAELEQKTIAGRVRDNYYARAAQQLALGGTPPYGYTGKNVRISNHTATILEFQPDEAAQVQALYGLRHRRAERGTAGAGGKPFRQPYPKRGELVEQRRFAYPAQPGVCPGRPPERCLFAGTGRGTDPSAGTVLPGQRLPGLRQSSRTPRRKADPAAGRTYGGRNSPRHRGQRPVAERPGTAGGSWRLYQPWLQGLAVCGLCGAHCYARNNGKGAAYTYFVCRGKRQGICPGIPGLRTQWVEDAVSPILAQQAEQLLPYAETTPRLDPAAVALEELEQRMRCLAAELSQPTAAADFLREELNRLAQERRELEQQLRRESTGRTETPAGSWAAWWETAGLEQRRQAAALLLREVRLYPDHGEAVLH